MVAKHGEAPAYLEVAEQPGRQSQLELYMRETLDTPLPKDVTWEELCQHAANQLAQHGVQHLNDRPWEDATLAILERAGGLSDQDRISDTVSPDKVRIFTIENSAGRSYTVKQFGYLQNDTIAAHPFLVIQAKYPFMLRAEGEIRRAYQFKSYIIDIDQQGRGYTQDGIMPSDTPTLIDVLDAIRRPDQAFSFLRATQYEPPETYTSKQAFSYEQRVRAAELAKTVLHNSSLAKLVVHDPVEYSTKLRAAVEYNGQKELFGIAIGDYYGNGLVVEHVISDGAKYPEVVKGYFDCSHGNARIYYRDENEQFMSETIEGRAAARVLIDILEHLLVCSAQYVFRATDRKEQALFESSELRSVTTIDVPLLDLVYDK